MIAIKYQEAMLKTAKIWAKMSSCLRGQVGAVIAKDNRIVSIGYNGTPTGTSNKCEDTLVCPCGISYDLNMAGVIIECKCGKVYYPKERDKYPELLRTNHKKVIHGEANAILFASKNGIPLKNTTLYVTTAPCSECAKMIIQAGIREVVYLANYHDTFGLDLLNSCGIEVRQFTGDLSDD